MKFRYSYQANWKEKYIRLNTLRLFKKESFLFKRLYVEKLCNWKFYSTQQNSASSFCRMIMGASNCGNYSIGKKFLVGVVKFDYVILAE